MWVAQYYKFDKPNRWINSGGLGTMGFGLPAAIGAQLSISKRASYLRYRRSKYFDVYSRIVNMPTIWFAY